MKTFRKPPVILLKLISITLLPVLEAQEVKVWPEVTGYLGHDVTLPCQFIPGPQGSNITQVQWELKPPAEEKTIIIVYNVQFGVNVYESFLKDRVKIAEQSLVIHDVEKRDAGSYTCSIVTFPGGLFEGATNLVVQALEAQVEVRPEVTGYLGHDVTLPCQFRDINIAQVQWELKPTGGEEVIVIIVSRVQSGVHVYESFLKDRVEMSGQSLIIRGVEMRDAGSYTCSITAFPSGSSEGTTNLVVQEPMQILPRMIAAGVFVLIVVTMLATTCCIVSRISREASARKHAVSDQ